MASGATPAREIIDRHESRDVCISLGGSFFSPVHLASICNK